jgi:alanine racemase
MPPQQDDILISPPRTLAEIDLPALRHNLRLAAMRANSPAMAVVKADAYGHGLSRVAKALANDATFFGVATVAEAREIRTCGIHNPVFLLGPSLPDERAEIAALDVTPSISSRQEAHDFARLGIQRGRPLHGHLMIDTGMGREGFQPDNLAESWHSLNAVNGLNIDGLATHLPSADEDPAFTRKQLRQFQEIASSLGGTHRFRWIHAANSAGVLGYQSDDLFSLARPGLMLYGVAPVACDPAHSPLPVMRLVGRVTLVRTLPTGHGVSYGGTYQTTRPTRIATVGLGYGDGYPRAVSGNHPDVFSNGRRLPILGRVTMDQVMIDATSTPDLDIGDDVEFFGPNIPVSEVAEKAGTIAWEVLTGITRRVIRTSLPA